jgi:hypothetical protein
MTKCDPGILLMTVCALESPEYEMWHWNSSNDEVLSWNCPDDGVYDP